MFHIHGMRARLIGTGTISERRKRMFRAFNKSNGFEVRLQCGQLFQFSLCFGTSKWQLFCTFAKRRRANISLSLAHHIHNLKYYFLITFEAHPFNVITPGKSFHMPNEAFLPHLSFFLSLSPSQEPLSPGCSTVVHPQESAWVSLFHLLIQASLKNLSAKFSLCLSPFLSSCPQGSSSKSSQKNDDEDVPNFCHLNSSFTFMTSHFFLMARPPWKFLYHY